MAEKSEIQWTDSTWNPWHGCKKVSKGCKYCYMYRGKERFKQDPTIVLRSKNRFKDPLKWKEPKMIFTCSWSDWFIQDADEWRAEAWEIIKATPQHTYQILTKRPERIIECLPEDWGDGYPNVWIGISVEDQDAANERIPFLKGFDAVIKFVSFEPLLDDINLLTEDLKYVIWKPFMNEDGNFDISINMAFDWAIIGGESGNENGTYKYRPCYINSILSLTTLLMEVDVKVFIKQFGTYLSKHLGYKDRHGGNIEEWPINMQIREMPNK